MSRYLSPEYGIGFDEEIARRYQPRILDPYGYSASETPELYFRIVEKGDEKCIEYFHYWKEQNCRQSYMLTDPAVISLITALVVALAAWAVVTLWSLFAYPVSRLTAAALILLLFLVGGVGGYRWSSEFARIWRPVTGRLIGGFFTHPNDFEPIFVFLEGESIRRIAVSGKGDVESIPHRNDIFVSSEDLREGECVFLTSEKPQYPYGKTRANEFFKEFPLVEANIREDHPSFLIATCFHTFARIPSETRLEGQDPLEAKGLEPLTDEVLDLWYEKMHFGHDVSDPFAYPYIQFAPPHTAKQLSQRDILLRILGGLGMIAKGAFRVTDTILHILRIRRLR